MTVNTNSEGTRKTITSKLSTTSATTIYTGAGPSAYLSSLVICNITAAEAQIDLWVNDGSTDFYIFNGYPIAGGGTLMLQDHAVNVDDGWLLRAQADTSDAFDITGVLIQQAPQNR